MEDSPFIKSLKRIFQQDAFSFGFWIGIAILALINFVSLEISHSEFINREMKFSHGSYCGGIPFPAYCEHMGSPGGSGFIRELLAVDILIGVIFSILSGIVFNMIWSKITSRQTG